MTALASSASAQVETPLEPVGGRGPGPQLGLFAPHAELGFGADRDTGVITSVMGISWLRVPGHQLSMQIPMAIGLGGPAVRTGNASFSQTWHTTGALRFSYTLAHYLPSVRAGDVDDLDENDAHLAASEHRLYRLASVTQGLADSWAWEPNALSTVSTFTLSGVVADRLELGASAALAFQFMDGPESRGAVAAQLRLDAGIRLTPGIAFGLRVTGVGRRSFEENALSLEPYARFAIGRAHLEAAFDATANEHGFGALGWGGRVTVGARL